MFLLLLCLSFLCCLQHTNAFTRDFGSSDDFCSNGPNSYFCSRDCNHYYYCNGQKKGKLLRCPTGTSCKKLGPHKKYADTDAAGVANMFDTWDVTYACEANPIENTCWSTRAPGLCENAASQDQTCSGGGSCRSTSPACAANPASRSCMWDTPAPEQCQCFTTRSNPPTTFDPTYTSNVTAKQKEGVSCSVIDPGIRAQCDPPMDVLFVSDASDSITREVLPTCYSNNQVISCDTNPLPANMISVYDEYAKARNFAKKFMSYFVIAPNAVKLGYLAFTKDVVLTRQDGKQVCANEIAADGTGFNFATDSAVEYDNCNPPYAVSADLQAVLASDGSTAARSIDMKYYQGGTKMFLGMSIARQVLESEKADGRSQLVIFVTDGVDSFAPQLLAQAAELKKNGVRIVTIAAGDVVNSARNEGANPTIKPKDPRGALATLRDAATSCTCTYDGKPCVGGKDSGGWACMGPATCVGDCYQSTNYQELVDTVVVDIVRQNCEMLTSIKPGLICSSRSTTLVATGQGFGARAPASGQIKFKVGDKQFDGTWLSDNGAKLHLGPWNNQRGDQFGRDYIWDPVNDPSLKQELRVQVSIDGGKSWLRETIESGFTIQYHVCEKVDRCTPFDGTKNMNCYDCHEGLNTVQIHGERFGLGRNGDEQNDEMVCGFGNIAVRAKWIDSGKAECIVPPLNCTHQDAFCISAEVNEVQNPTPPMTPSTAPLLSGPSNPDYSVFVQFNFSLDGGDNWFPLNKTMEKFEYKPCRPVCLYTETFAPFPLILLLLASLLCCIPPLALCIGSKQPLPMPPLHRSPEPEPPPPLIFKTIPTVVIKKIKKTKVIKTPKAKKEEKKKPPGKKKWAVAAGQYIRDGKNTAVGWGKYGEAEHGEELLDDFDEDEESTEEEPDEEYETDLAVSLAFDDVEETVEMPQAPEDVPMPEIQPIEGIELDQEDTCRDKCNRCLKDWKWKWWLIFLIVLVMMGLAIWMLTEEHNRLDAEINARTYGLSDPACRRNPGISNDTQIPSYLWIW